MSRQIVIIGGGVIGLSTALACAKRGHRVTVIEKDPQVRGASLGNAGMVVPSHFTPLAAPGMVAQGLRWMTDPESPFAIRPRPDWGLQKWGLKFWRAGTTAHATRCAPLLRDLSLASRALYLELADAESFGLSQQGLLMLCQTAHGLEEEARAAEKAVALGLQAEVLDAAETARLEPGVAMSITGSVHYPQDCHLEPTLYVEALLKRLRAAGSELVEGAEMLGWRKHGARLAAVTTTQGEVTGDTFVLAGGAWSAGLVRGLGLRLSLQAGKGYSLTIPDPVTLPQRGAILTEARVAVTPMGNALRFGGTMEMTGLDETINPRRIAGIVKAALRYYPDFREEHFAGVEPWRGLRPCPPDGLPYLGPTRAAENLIVATGHGMMGLSLAPVTGEIVGRLVDDEPPGFDRFEMLSPDR
jgi:D-amino-acid dehydrogenase